MPKSYRPNALRRIAKGLCPNCSSTPKKDRIYCQTCIDRSAEAAKDRYATIRREVLAAYGGKCIKCGFDRSAGLFVRQIEGVKPEGRKNLTAHLHREGFPPG